MIDLDKLPKEYNMDFIETLVVTSTISDLSVKDNELEKLWSNLFDKLLEKNYINQKYFINFSNKITEVEDTETMKTKFIWLIECSAIVYRA